MQQTPLNRLSYYLLKTFVCIPIFLSSLLFSAHSVAAEQPRGEVEVRVVDILGRPLFTEIRFIPKSTGVESSHELPEGEGHLSIEEGEYSAYISVRSNSPSVLVSIQDITVSAGAPARLALELLEGASGNLSLGQFDVDFDGVLDSLELKQGTDPDDPLSAPGLIPYTWPSPVLSEKGDWYCGELNAYSTYGRGKWTVEELVRSAEKRGLDFLAITDRNKLDAVFDPAFRSKKVVLIPALEWGDDERGVAHIYAPATLPLVPERLEDSEVVALRVQLQGGIFVVAHPCFPGSSWSSAPWQWPANYVNGIQVWCREWRKVPPVTLDHLQPYTRARVNSKENSPFQYSVAYAANTRGLSANGQAAIFWDKQLLRGFRSSVIAGSGSASPDVPLGSPITYVYAKEKSLNGIINGLRNGWTFVTTGKDGPFIDFQADIGDDGPVEVGVGGVIPVNVLSRLVIGIDRAKGKRYEILMNGHPIASGTVPSDDYTLMKMETPDRLSVYRVRVMEAAQEPGFGPADVLAMTSPIYAHGILADPDAPDMAGWIDVDSQWQDPRSYDTYLPSNPEASEIPVRSSE